MQKLLQAINQQQEQLRQLIQNHNYLCQRFRKAQEYFDNENISIKDKQTQQDNIIVLMRELNESIQNIYNLGYTLTEKEKIQGVDI